MIIIMMHPVLPENSVISNLFSKSPSKKGDFFSDLLKTLLSYIINDRGKKGIRR